MPSQQKLTPTFVPEHPIIHNVQIGHVHLKTAALQPIFDFYVSILGFSVMAEMPTALFLSAGQYHHTLAFNTWESQGGTPAPFGHTGLYHIAILYPTRAALADALYRLQGAGWPLEGTNDHGTHEALYLRDPDQNGLELYYDKPMELWPTDSDGHLSFSSAPLDLEQLLRERMEA